MPLETRSGVCATAQHTVQPPSHTRNYKFHHTKRLQIHASRARSAPRRFDPSRRSGDGLAKPNIKRHRGASTPSRQRISLPLPLTRAPALLLTHTHTHALDSDPQPTKPMPLSQQKKKEQTNTGHTQRQRSDKEERAKHLLTARRRRPPRPSFG